MIAGLAITWIALAVGAPQEAPIAEADHAPTAVEHVQEADDGHGAESAADDQHAADAEHDEEWGTEAMMHHIVDAEALEFGPVVISLERLKVPPVELGGVKIDLSPTKHVIFLMLASLLTILTIGLAARRARRTDAGKEAPRGILNMFEAFYLYLRDDVALANIGHGGERFVPYVVTLFFFILYANLLGLIPFGASATGNISVTAALAIISLIVVEVAGYKALGAKGYLGTIFYIPKGIPVVMQVVMLIIMTPVELIGKLAKPFALAVRLFANMTAGHFVLLSLLGLIIVYGGLSATGVAAVTGSLGLGLFVMFLEIFVGFLQAYIFTALTAVFIGLIRHAH
ncbi:MAG: F0F1 ATP synthase subunit A [marine benthic group bacterium]|nr:F0F1 ATP synthase subunit A [Candidatus Benthicola marisminoris]